MPLVLSRRRPNWHRLAAVGQTFKLSVQPAFLVARLFCRPGLSFEKVCKLKGAHELWPGWPEAPAG